MLPAEMANIADRTRNRQCQDAVANPEEGDASADPEVVLPNNVDGDNPPVIPEQEEGEPRDAYAFRVMQAVTQHEIESFTQMIKLMKDVSKEVTKRKNEWGETEEEEGDTDNSEYQDVPEDHESEESGRESKPPSSREHLENVLNPIY